MTKELFVETLKFIKKKQDQDAKFCDVLEELCPGYRCDAMVNSEAVNYILKLLGDIMQDKDDDIGYFLYETGAIENDDLSIPNNRAPTWDDKPLYTSPETLYDYLSSNIK